MNAKTFLPRQFLPYAVKIGSPAFRRKLIEICPFECIRTLLHISDTTCQCAADILKEKKEALAAGDESIINGRVGKGKDIMSALRKFLAVAMPRTSTSPLAIQ